MNRVNPNAGLTIVELMVVLAILSVVGYAAGTTMIIGSDAANDTVTREGLRERAHFIVNRIAKELLVTSAAEVSVSGADKSSITYKQVTGYDIPTDTVELGDPITIQMETLPWGIGVTKTEGSNKVWWGMNVAQFAAGEIGGNLTDDNGNGLIDEAGLSFDMTGNTVIIRLTLEKKDSKQRNIAMVEEMTTRIYIRHP